MKRSLLLRSLRALVPAVLVLALGRSAAAAEFVHLTDTHVVRLQGVQRDLAAARWYQGDSGARLGRVLARLSDDAPPDFFLITGDLVDAQALQGVCGGWVTGQIETFRDAFDRSRIPVFLTLGNHDLTRFRFDEGKRVLVSDRSAAGAAREAWKQAFPVFKDGTYYAIRRQAGRTDYLILVLDNGHPSGDPDFTAAQVTWLTKQIAGHRSGPVILAMHIPIQTDAFSKSLKAAIGGVPNVVLSIAGHRHSNAVDEIDVGGRNLTQVRTAALYHDDANWRRLRLLEGRIEVCAPGRRDAIEKTIKVP